MEARTFEMEFAKFIQKFHQEIRDVFIEDTFHKREILAHYQLAREMLEELADSGTDRIHCQHRQENLSGNNS